jgi:putative transposase
MRVLDENVRTFFMKNFGCCRKVYNLYVDWLYKQLENFGYVGEDSIPGFKLPEVTEFKKEFDFLKEVDSLGLANAKISFEKAINHFNKECDHKTYTKGAKRRDESGTEKLSFRGLVGMPKFHSKAHGDFSYTTNCQYPTESCKLKNPTILLEGNRLYLPKLKEGVELIVHRPLPKDARIGNVTMSMDTDGRMFASIEYECEIETNTEIQHAVLNEDTRTLNSLNILVWIIRRSISMWTVREGKPTTRTTT